MDQSQEQSPSATLKVERLTAFKSSDLADICEATERTIMDNAIGFTIGFGREDIMARERLEAYWQGVLLVPERVLVVGRLDGVISSSVQLIKPNPNNQTSYFSGSITQHFVAPWARGFGLAKRILECAEGEARAAGLTVLRLRVNATLSAAISLYESCGYKRWGTLDKYEIIDGKMTAGYFYYKDL